MILPCEFYFSKILHLCVLNILLREFELITLRIKGLIQYGHIEDRGDYYARGETHAAVGPLPPRPSRPLPPTSSVVVAASPPLPKVVGGLL